MAVTKTPRKKPATEAAEAEPAPAKAKAPAKKAAPAKPSKAKSAPAPEPAVEATPEPQAEAKKAAPKGRKPKAEATAPEAPPPVPAPVAATPAPAPAAQLPSQALAILAAIQDGRALEFIFADADANAPRTFEPRTLSFDTLSQAWYVWGWDRRYNAERHHRVDLLAEVNAVEGVGRAAQGPYADGTPGNRIGGWLGGDPIAVKATLLKQWVFAVKQAPPAFPAFKLEDQADGSALVTFTATDLRAIARWIMQFGDGVQVQEPARLVDRVKQVGAVWAGRERQAAPAPAPKPAPRPEPAPEPRRHESRPPRQERERDEAPKAKPGKVEIIHFDRL